MEMVRHDLHADKKIKVGLNKTFLLISCIL